MNRVWLMGLLRRVVDAEEFECVVTLLGNGETEWCEESVRVNWSNQKNKNYSDLLGVR